MFHGDPPLIASFQRIELHPFATINQPPKEAEFNSLRKLLSIWLLIIDYLLRNRLNRWMNCAAHAA
jgi:hypothetical protein